MLQLEEAGRPREMHVIPPWVLASKAAGRIEGTRRKTLVGIDHGHRSTGFSLPTHVCLQDWSSMEFRSCVANKPSNVSLSNEDHTHGSTPRTQAGNRCSGIPWSCPSLGQQRRAAPTAAAAETTGSRRATKTSAPAPPRLPRLASSQPKHLPDRGSPSPGSRETRNLAGRRPFPPSARGCPTTATTAAAPLGAPRRDPRGSASRGEGGKRHSSAETRHHRRGDRCRS